MSRPGFSFLVCPDSALLNQEMEKQLAASLPARENWKRLVFWGDEEPGAAFWGNLSQVGLFAENKMLVVRHAENWAASVWKDVSAALSRQLAHIWPFFCLECAWDKNRPKIPAHIQKTACYAFAQKKGWQWQSPGLTGQTLKDFARQEAKKFGLHFDSDCFNAFCATVSTDAQSVVCEMEKLSLLAANGKVEKNMLTPNAVNMESDAFLLIKKIAAGDLPGVWKELASAADGSLLFFVIALLARDFRTLWQIAAKQDVRLYPAEAGRKKALAHKLGFPGLAKGFAALSEAEFQVKSGRLPPEQALEALVIKLMPLYSDNKS